MTGIEQDSSKKQRKIRMEQLLSVVVESGFYAVETFDLPILLFTTTVGAGLLLKHAFEQDCHCKEDKRDFRDIGLG